MHHRKSASTMSQPRAPFCALVGMISQPVVTPTRQATSSCEVFGKMNWLHVTTSDSLSPFMTMWWLFWSLIKTCGQLCQTLVTVCWSPWQQLWRPFDNPDDSWWQSYYDLLWIHWQLLWWCCHMMVLNKNDVMTCRCSLLLQ